MTSERICCLFCLAYTLYFTAYTFPRLHRSLQYFTSSQLLRHFLRLVNGRPHVAQIFVSFGSWRWVLLTLLILAST